MKDLSKFTIDIYKLSNAKHEYQFDIDNSFFHHFNYGLIERGQAKVDVLLDKRETFIELNFKINGTVELTCDRSLEKFNFPLNSDDNIILKFGEEEKEVTEEITIISKSTQRINIAQYIYEFIAISIPYKKIHPKYADEDEFDDEETEGTIVYSDAEHNEAPGEKDEEDIDPRWNALKNLKNK